MQQFESPSVNFLPLNFEHVQRRPDATIFLHKTNAMHRATEATGRMKC